jgi:hypothetical protein
MANPIVLPNVTVGPEDEPKPLVLPNVTVGPQEDMNADLAQLRAIGAPPAAGPPVGMDAILEAANRVAQAPRAMQSFQRTSSLPPYPAVTPETAAQFMAQPAPPADAVSGPPVGPPAPPPPVTRGGYGGPDTSHLAALQEQSDRLDSGVQTERLMQTNETRREAEAAGNESRDMDYDFKQEVDSTKRKDC